jgi:photosystem II stability/assembly factor-like uncharacterized protein
LILYRSIDGGIAWTPFQNGLPSPVTAFAVDPHDSTALYAATGSGVFRSGDAGTSWTAMNDGLTHTGCGYRVERLRQRLGSRPHVHLHGDDDRGSIGDDNLRT